MSLHHTLSRLLSGELSAEEEAAVRAQIATDPAAEGEGATDGEAVTDDTAG